jgi:hypothetical protein
LPGFDSAADPYEHPLRLGESVQREVKTVLDRNPGEWHTVADLLAALPGRFDRSKRGRRSLTDALRSLAERGLVEIRGEEPEEGEENDDRLFRVV